MWSVLETGRHPWRQRCCHLLQPTKMINSTELQKQKRKEEIQIWKRSRGLPSQSENRYFTCFNIKWSALIPSGINPFLWVTQAYASTAYASTADWARTEGSGPNRRPVDLETRGGMTLHARCCVVNVNIGWIIQAPEVTRSLISRPSAFETAHSSIIFIFHNLQHVWYFI